MEFFGMHYGWMMLFASVILIVWSSVMIATDDYYGSMTVRGITTFSITCAVIGLLFAVGLLIKPDVHDAIPFGIARLILVASLIANIIDTVRYRTGCYD